MRRTTPESWHVGGATYLALALLLVPLALSVDRRLADWVSGTVVVRGDTQTSVSHRRILSVIDVVGIAGVLGLAIAHIVFFAPLLRFPTLL